MQFKKLYKRDERGNVRVWWAEQDNENHRIHSGIQDGKMTISKWKTSKAKNIGKTNETNPSQQCRIDIENLYKSKMKKHHYFQNIEDIDNFTFHVPMTANKYKTFKYDYVYSSKKYDGVRCIATKDGLQTRGGETITSMNHINDALKDIFRKYPDVILDGELYTHKLRHNLNKISGAVSRDENITEDDINTALMIEYHIYDMILEAPFNERLFTMESVVEENEYIKRVEHTKVTSEDELDELFNQYVEDEYEGQMVRVDGVNYENKRSNYLLKRKDFQSDEFTIVDVLEGEGNRSGMAGKLTLLTKDNKTFNCSIRGGNDFYKELLENKEEYINGEATVEYLKYSEYGIPVIPVAVNVFKGKRNN